MSKTIRSFCSFGVTFSLSALFLLASALPCLADGADVDPSQEYLQEQQKIQEQYQKFSVLNPMSQDSNSAGLTAVDPAAAGQNPGDAQVAKLLETQNRMIAGLQTLQKYPIVQKLVDVVKNPHFLDKLQELIKSPNLGQLAYFQLGWIVVFFFLKLILGWKLAISGIITRLFSSLLLTLLYFFVASYVIPAYLFGSSFTDLVQMLYVGVLK